MGNKEEKNNTVPNGSTEITGRRKTGENFVCTDQ